MTYLLFRKLSALRHKSKMRAGLLKIKYTNYIQPTFLEPSHSPDTHQWPKPLIR